MIEPGTCVIYARASTRRQVENLQDQVDFCSDFAASRSLIVAEIFVDGGRTGFNGDRDDYKKMLAWIREHRGVVQYLVVRDISRVWRDSSEYHSLKAIVTKFGVRIISAREGAIDESPEGRLIEGAVAMAASYDATLKKELSAKAQEALIARGLWPFRAPLGYLPGKPKGYLVPDERIAPAIRQLFEIVGIGGLTLTELPSRAEELNLFRQGRLLSSVAQFRRILTNPLYAGRIVVKSRLASTSRFPPIVDAELFDTVQLRLSGRARVMRNYVPRLPLSGFVTCRECGYALSGSYAKGRYGWYRCKDACVRVRDLDLHRLFVAFADSLTPEYGIEADLRTSTMMRWDWKHSAERGRIEQALEQVCARKDQLIQWRQDASLQESEWLRRIEAERVNERVLRERLDDALDSSAAHEALLRQLTARVLTSPGEVWNTLPIALQRRLQGTLFPEGVVLDRGRLRTHATCPVFRAFGESFVQCRTLASPSDRKLEPEGRPWHRLPRKEQERLMTRYFGEGVDVGICFSSVETPRVHRQSAAM